MPVMMPPNTADHHPPVAVRVYPAGYPGTRPEPAIAALQNVPTGAPSAERTGAVPNPAERAIEAGIAAAWTGRCDGTVDLTRLAGPRSGWLSPTDVGSVELPGSPPWPLARAAVRCALYEWALVEGTQFDIYRWVNLFDLAAVWPSLRLPDGVHAEWERVLRAAGLLPAN